MAEQLYDIKFEFWFDGNCSEESLHFCSLTFKSLEELLSKFSQYGCVPDYWYANDNVKTNQNFIINLDKPGTPSIWFSIDYADTLYSAEEIVSHVNSGLIKFIRENTSVEGFL